MAQVFTLPAELQQGGDGSKIPEPITPKGVGLLKKDVGPALSIEQDALGLPALKLRSDLTRQAAASFLDAPAGIPGLLGLSALGIETVVGAEPTVSGPLLGVAGDIVDFANRTAGTTLPKTPAQAAVRVGASFLLPLPKIPRGATRLGRIARNTGEVVTPGTFGFTPGRLAANLAVGFTLDQALRRAIAPESPAILRFGDSPKAPEATPAEVTMKPSAQEVTFELLEELNPEVSKKTSTLDMLLTAAAVAAGSAVAIKAFSKSRARRSDVVTPGTQETFNIDPSLVSASRPGPAFRTRSVNDLADLDDLSRRTGKPEAGTTTEALVNLSRRLTRGGGMQVIASWFKTGIMEGMEKKVRPLADLQEIYGRLPKEMRDIFDNFVFAKDALENAKRATDELRGTLRGIDARLARLTEPSEIAKLQKVRDEVASNFKPGTTISNPSFTKFVESGEAKKAVDLVMAKHPGLVKLSTELNSNFKHVLNYAHQEGYITTALKRSITKAHPNFIPNVAAKQVDGVSGFVDALIKNTNPNLPEAAVVNVVRQLMRRTSAHGTFDPATGAKTAGGVEVALNPMQAAEQAMTGMLHAININTARRAWIDELISAVNPEIQNHIKRFSRATKDARKKFKKAEDDGFGITIFRNGAEEAYILANRMTVSALKFAPHRSRIPLLNKSRKLWQALVTGPGNPGFAGKAFLWAQVYTPLMRAKGYAGGPFEWLAKKLTGDRIGEMAKGIDVSLGALGASNFASNVAGKGGLLSDIVRHQAAGALSRQIRTALDAGSPFYKALGEQRMRTIADRMTAYHLRSVRNTMERLGVFNTGMMEDAIHGGRTLLESTTRHFSNKFGPVVGKMMWNAYKGILEAAFQAPRARFFVMNFKKGMSKSEVNKLGAATRSMDGDFSRRGLGAAPGDLRTSKGGFERSQALLTQLYGKHITPLGAAENLPYANVAIQAIARVGEMIKASPEGFAAGLFHGVAMPALAGMLLVEYMGPEYKDWYWNRLSSTDRVSGFYLPVPGVPASEGIYVPVPPEMALILSPFLNGIAALLNLGPDDNRWDRAKADFFDGFAQAAGLPLPPIANVVLAGAFGATLDPSRQIRGMGGSTEIRTVSPGLSGETDRDVKRIDSTFSAKTEEMLRAQFGVAFTLALDVYDTATRAISRGSDNVVGEMFQQLGMSLVLPRKSLAAVTGIFREPGLNYTKASLGSKLHAADRVVEVFERMFLQGASSMEAPVDLGPGLQRSPTNPLFVKVAPQAALYFKQNPVLTDLKRDRNIVRNQITVAQSRRNLPMTRTKLDHVNELRLQEKRLAEMMMQEVQRFETALGVKIEDLDPFASS